MADTPRIALVTGGNRGIGLATARALADAGHRVAVTSRSGDPVDGLLTLPCDVTDDEQVDAAFSFAEAAHGPVEVLVANAGISRDGLLLRSGVEDFQATLDTNLTGAFRIAKRASKGMLRGRWGRLVFLSSVVGLTGSAGQSSYAASKAGLIGFSRSLARELGSRGVTVNCVSPGIIATPMSESTFTPERVASLVPLQRMGTPDEVAAAVAFLASDAASYITGQIIPVNGGMS